MISIEQRGSRLIISNFNESGEVELHTFNVPKGEQFNWEYNTLEGKKEDGLKSWDGRYVQKRHDRFLNRFRVIEWLESLSEKEKSKIYDFNQPKKFFCDIEVEIQDGFPEAEKANTPVVSIALSDDDNNITVFGTKEIALKDTLELEHKLKDYFKDYTPNLKFKYKHFNSEYDMLYTFFVQVLPKIPFLTGWYFIDFDWKYLYNRCIKLQVPIEKCSITGRLMGKDYLPIHKVVVDYKEIYEKWDKTLKENLTLDWTAKNKLGLTKVKYSGSLKELYNNDYLLFVFYNAVDTHLVNLLDKKTSVADIFFKLGTLTKSEYAKAFSPVHMTENVLCRGLLKRNLVMIPPQKDEKKEKNEKYKGAYVHKPKVGLYEYVAAFDFASLYPSVMRQFNISPESFIGLMNKEDNTVLNTETKQNESIEDKIVCANGAVFSTETSVLREALDDFYSKRKKAKYESYEVEKEIEILKQHLEKRKRNG
jgi:DNA polymerase elongation subunit (family B)